MHREPEKMEVKCPECGKVQEILWFRWKFGESGSQQQEKVEGKCECGYKFKVDDLD